MIQAIIFRLALYMIDLVRVLRISFVPHFSHKDFLLEFVEGHSLLGPKSPADNTREMNISWPTAHITTEIVPSATIAGKRLIESR